MVKAFNLKYPPIKKTYSKLPNELVHHAVISKYDRYGFDSFIMFKTKEPNVFTRMSCYPSSVKRDGVTNVPSMYVWTLISSPPRNGLGTKMLNFARKISEQKGCNGYFHLNADVGFLPYSVPHVFYKKYGMNTSDSQINKKLDKFVKKKKNATYKDFNNIRMFYPPITKLEPRWKILLKKIFI